MKNSPHPIQYQGSKRNLAPTILRYMPKTFNRLIEPFAGSAAISIAVAAQHIAKSYLINDLNKPLVELLRFIIEIPIEIAFAYERLWNEQHDDSIGHYYKVREEFNHTQDPRLFLYLLARCVKGSVRYNADGFFNQSPDKRRKGTQPETMRKNILGVSSLLNGKTEFLSIDYKDVIAKVKPNDLVYMDPPYQGVCGPRDSRYFSGIHHNEFIKTLKFLNENGIDYIVSYDGRRGDKTFGQSLPPSLELTHIELRAGRSSQATLLGKNELTYESLYLSRTLTKKLNHKSTNCHLSKAQQLPLFESVCHYA